MEADLKLALTNPMKQKCLLCLLQLYSDFLNHETLFKTAQKLHKSFVDTKMFMQKLGQIIVEAANIVQMQQMG